MPELPEVETVARSLRPRLLGRAVLRTWSSGMALRQPIDATGLLDLHGATIQQIDRVGKYLLFRFSNGRTLLSHLGMSGRYVISPVNAEVEPHTHLRFHLDTPAELRYVDPRRFGLAVLRDSGSVPELDALGPDPLLPAFTHDHFLGALQGSGRDLKALLLDQQVVAGLGNIYVAESLFQAGLRPKRTGISVTRPAAIRLHAAIKATLEAAIERRGTTLSDGGYIDADGLAGDNQNHLMVYDRGGQPCRVCGRAIQRIVQTHRSSYYCPGCQR